MAEVPSEPEAEVLLSDSGRCHVTRRPPSSNRKEARSMRLSMMAKTAFPLLSLCVLLAACGGGREPDVVRSCPGLVGVEDAMEQTHFVGGGRDLTDVDFTARIDDVRYGCIYTDAGNAIETELLVQLVAARGPANQDNQAQVGYFIAVGKQRDQGAPDILVREAYQATADFRGNHTSVLLNDELSMTIPIQPGQRGDDFTIFVGLLLEETEVEYNRRQMR